MPTLLSKTLLAIDDINKQDPNKITIDDLNGDKSLQFKELIYGQQMTACLEQYWSNNDEILQIAVRAQHIKRWHLPRSEFPQNKAGYYQWRIALGKFHAELTQQLMLEHGYSDEMATNTASILRKENLKTSHHTQTLEDVACLVFLQHYFGDFASKHNEKKIIRILQKTWKKMSPKGQKIALTFNLPQQLAKLVEKALA